MDKEKQVNYGAKLFDEFMVDIFGAIIPGFMFIVAILFSVVAPLTIYTQFFYIPESSASNMLNNGSFWWVLFLACLVLSYFIGHILMRRSSIDIADQESIKNELDREMRRMGKDDYKIGEVVRKLKEYLALIDKALSNPIAARFNPPFRRCLQIESHNLYVLLNGLHREEDMLKMIEGINRKLIVVAFPEYFYELTPDELNNNYSTLLSNLPSTIQKMIDEYKDKYKKKFNKDDDNQKNLDALYTILRRQMASATSGLKSIQCLYPYQNYYKYLIQRYGVETLRHVDWSMPHERSKNRINKLKLRIKLFANESYSELNKNEAHIRLSSSTWTGTKSLIYITAVSTAIFLVCLIISLSPIESSTTLYYVTQYVKCSTCIQMRFVAFLLPALSLVMTLYSKHSVKEHLHYQRKREIQYTLQIYNQCEDIINHTQKILAGNNISRNNVQNTYNQYNFYDGDVLSNDNQQPFFYD